MYHLLKTLAFLGRDWSKIRTDFQWSSSKKLSPERRAQLTIAEINADVLNGQIKQKLKSKSKAYLQESRL